MDKDLYSQRILENGLLSKCPYLIKYSPDVLLNKTKCFEYLQCGEKMFHKNQNRIKSLGDMDKDPFP